MQDIYEYMPYGIDSCNLNDGAKMISEHVNQRLYLIECGEVADRRDLFGEAVLASTSAFEHQYVLDRNLAYLVAFGEIDLEFAGVNDDGETLYRRCDV